MKNTTKLLSLIAAVVAVGAVFFSCESLWDGTGDGDTGTLTVLLTDAPFPADSVAEANVTIDSLVVHDKVSDTFITLSRERAVFNLLDLRNGITDSLVVVEIPAGEYNQLRLFVNNDGASVILNDGTTAPLTVPSGEQSGLMLNVKPAIKVAEGIEYELLLDFDVSKSFTMLGEHNGQGSGVVTGFHFKPVVRAVNLSTAGRLVGTVTDTSTVANPIPDAQVWVWSVELDSVISNTFTDTLTGDYQLIGLAAGFYTAHATVAGHDTVSFTNVEIIAATATERDFALTPLPEE